MKVGILGGSFDPPHEGHLHMARWSQESLGLDRVLFIPCARQPLKESDPLASAYHRAAMVALATAHRPDWRLNLVELERGGVSFTVETLEILGERFGVGDMTLILGSDSLITLPRWKGAEDLQKRVEIVVVPREEGFNPPPWFEAAGSRVRVLACPPLVVSSTKVRELLAAGGSVEGMVPPLVEGYIRKHGLYGSKAGTGQ